MRIYVCIIFLLAGLSARGQTYSSLSTPVRFEVPLKINGFSKPTYFNIDIRQTNSKVTESTNKLTPISNETITTTDNSKFKKEELSLEIEMSQSVLPKYYCLIIGVSDYLHNDLQLRDLNNAVKDAIALKTKLIDGFSFDNDKTTLLENPTRQEIIQQLEVLAAKITPKDNLLIFYAGHGIWDSRIKVGYWLPADAKTNDKSSWIANSTIRDYIAGINSKHTLLITDACFSGSIFKSRDLNLSDYGMANLYRLQSRKAMTSGSLSTVPDDSKFMYYFLKRLMDTEGKYISARQLFYGLETAVLNNSITVPQFGVIQDTGDEGGDFIFMRK